MSARTIVEQTRQPLSATAADAVVKMFAELREEFDREVAAAADEGGWKSARDAWLGRKSGVLSQITDNWLKPAAPELKRAVGQQLNELKSHVESVLAERQIAIEAAAESGVQAQCGIPSCRRFPTDRCHSSPSISRYRRRRVEVLMEGRSR